MHKIRCYKKYKLNSSELKIILSQMGFFNSLIIKKIRANQKPFFKQGKKKKNHIDLHLDLTKKIDEVISKNNDDQQISDNKEITIPRFIELREPFMRSPEIPVFQTGLGPQSDIGELDDVQEFFEIEPPTNFLMEKQPKNNEEFKGWMANNQNEKDQKTYWAFGTMKMEKKGNGPAKTTTKNNRNNISNNDETSIAKMELEVTKKEIERKKKELEEAIKKQKEKEIEIKKEEEERRKQEKLIKLELKKQLKEEKIKEKLEKKEEIEREKLEKKAQIEREIQLKKLAELKKKEELLKQIELKKQAELRKKEEIRRQLEIKRQELLKSKEEELFEKEQITPVRNNIVEEEKEYSPENLTWDEDIAKLLPIIDSLFEKLPEDVVDEFTSSEYFELYEKVLLKYKNK